MAYATLQDVRRILRIPQSDENAERDANLRVALAVMESWVEGKLPKLSAKGSQLEAYFDVHEDATLHLPADDITVTKLKVYEYPSSHGVPLSPIELGFGHGYDLTDDGDVLLRPTLYMSPFEGAETSRPPRTYARVEVYYEGTGRIPAAVTEGVAFLAAGYYTSGPKVLEGMLEEKIGDYSYKRASEDLTGQPPYISTGIMLLQPWMRKAGRVQVV